VSSKGIKQAIVADRPAFLSAFFANFYNVDVLGGKLSVTSCRLAGTSVCRRLPQRHSRFASRRGVPTFRNDLPTHQRTPRWSFTGDAETGILPIAASGAGTQKAVKGARLVVVEVAARLDLDPRWKQQP